MEVVEIDSSVSDTGLADARETWIAGATEYEESTDQIFESNLKRVLLATAFLLVVAAIVAFVNITRADGPSLAYGFAWVAGAVATTVVALVLYGIVLVYTSIARDIEIENIMCPGVVKYAQDRSGMEGWTFFIYSPSRATLETTRSSDLEPVEIRYDVFLDQFTERRGPDSTIGLITRDARQLRRHLQQN